MTDNRMTGDAAGEPNLRWSTPVLEELTVDLRAIATGGPKSNDAVPSAHIS